MKKQEMKNQQADPKERNQNPNRDNRNPSKPGSDPDQTPERETNEPPVAEPERNDRQPKKA